MSVCSQHFGWAQSPLSSTHLSLCSNSGFGELVDYYYDWYSRLRKNLWLIDEWPNERIVEHWRIWCVPPVYLIYLCKLWYITYKRPINIFCVYRYMRTTRNYVPSWKRWPWLWQPQRLLHGPRNGATRRQKCRHVSFPKLYIACTEVVLFAGLGIWNQALESWIPQTYWKLWRFSDVATAWFAGIAV